MEANLTVENFNELLQKRPDLFEDRDRSRLAELDAKLAELEAEFLENAADEIIDWCSQNETLKKAMNDPSSFLRAEVEDIDATTPKKEKNILDNLSLLREIKKGMENLNDRNPKND